MNLDELKSVWREEMNTAVDKSNVSYQKVVSNVKEIDRSARVGRNIIVLLTLAVTGLDIFIWFFVKPELNLAQHASMVLMLGLFGYLSYAMTRALRTSDEDNWTLSTRLDIEIEKISNQARMSRSLPVRFILPMFLIAMLGAFGGYYERTNTLIPDTNFTIYLGIAVILFAGTAWGFINSERKKLAPLLNELQGIQVQLVDEPN